MKLSNNFSLYDLTRSQVAMRRNLTEQFTPPEPIVDNLRRLCELILEPLWLKFPNNLVITSGYRCARLNKIVGGSPNSTHTKGLAVDIDTKGILKNLGVAYYIFNNIPFQKLILEGSALQPQWLHVEIPQLNNNFERLIFWAEFGHRTRYHNLKPSEIWSQ